MCLLQSQTQLQIVVKNNLRVMHREGQTDEEECIASNLFVAQQISIDMYSSFVCTVINKSIIFFVHRAPRALCR